VIEGRMSAVGGYGDVDCTIVRRIAILSWYSYTDKMC
jgi:hypothetical protein